MTSPEPNRGVSGMSNNPNTPAAGFFGLFRPPANQLADSQTMNGTNASTTTTTNSQVTINGVGRPQKPPVLRQQPNQNLSSSRDSSGLVKLPQMPERMKVTAGTNDWGR
jgi:hypothetical protein